ncbi:MAG: sugar phosphate isomerase/epimerase [Zavarzinella sp.]
MKLGYVTALFPEWTLEEHLSFAARTGYQCVEVMCWPVGKAERRYAGVTHIDVATLSEARIRSIQRSCIATGVSISGLGYYPNPLDPDPQVRADAAQHIIKVIEAAAALQIGVVNTFIGRDPSRMVDDQWQEMLDLWGPIVDFASKHQVKIGIENCPMLFSRDEWPGGKNLATTPAIWRKLFNSFPGRTLGLNFDPSHLVFQHIDYLRCIREFGERFYHVHAKDTRIDPDRIYEVGSMGLKWYTPKIPGLGDVQWGRFFSELTDTGYQGAVCVEVEDRVFEATLESRKQSLVQSYRYLHQFFA